MAKKKTIPQYTSVERKGIQYYRTRILDADGKQVSLYATTCEELYENLLNGLTLTLMKLSNANCHPSI